MLTYLVPPTKTVSLGFGKVGVPKRTIARMKEIIRVSSKNPYIRAWAEKITGHLHDRDEEGEVDSIFSFLQNHTRYVRDPRGTEYIQTPPYILKRIEVTRDTPGLDCDDYTTLGLTLLRSIGYETRIRAVGYQANGKFSHVYGLVKVNRRWMVFDAVRKDRPLGWEAKGKKVTMELKV